VFTHDTRFKPPNGRSKDRRYLSSWWWERSHIQSELSEPRNCPGDIRVVESRVSRARIQRHRHARERRL